MSSLGLEYGLGSGGLEGDTQGGLLVRFGLKKGLGSVYPILKLILTVIMFSSWILANPNAIFNVLGLSSFT